MWCFLSDCFVSIVASPEAGKGNLSVRARFKGDLQKLFPGCRVKTTPARDYRFRAFVSRERVAAALHREVMAMDYSNFKDSVPDDDRHDVYLRVWSVMHSAQQRAALPRRRQAPLPGWSLLPEPDDAEAPRWRGEVGDV